MPGTSGTRCFQDNVTDLKAQHINIGGKNSILVEAGDRLVIETPGGGGFGVDQGAEKDQQDKDMASFVPVAAGGSAGATRVLAEQV